MNRASWASPKHRTVGPCQAQRGLACLGCDLDLAAQLSTAQAQLTAEEDVAVIGPTKARWAYRARVDPTQPERSVCLVQHPGP